MDNVTMESSFTRFTMPATQPVINKFGVPGSDCHTKKAVIYWKQKFNHYHIIYTAHYKVSNLILFFI